MQKLSKKPAFMMHVVAGYPDMESSEQIAKRILDSGADYLEIQIPFSDPIADGPIIATANTVALQNGATVKEALKMIERVANSTKKPVLIMTYFNIINSYGVEAFCERAKEIGVAGIIVPDYPFDEERDNELIANCKKNSLNFIQVIASTTRPDRMKQVIKRSTGFVYCMARKGITGKKTDINTDTINYLKRIRKISQLPIAVGFGLSEKAQVKALKPYADIMVVGSALIKTYQDKPIDKALVAVSNFMKKLMN